MRQEISTVLTYGDLHTDAKTIVHSTITIPYTAKTPREPPVLPRPPKPPDNKGERGQERSNRDTNRDSRISLPQWTTLEEEKLQHTGHKKTEKQLQQPCQRIPHPNHLPAPDRTTLWAQMREYHSSSRKWHFNNEQSRTDDGSPLIWTMVHTSSAAWNWTYAWNRPLDEYIPWIACQTLPAKPVLLSYAMWTSRPPADLSADTPIRMPPSTTALTQPVQQKRLQSTQRTQRPPHDFSHPSNLAGNSMNQPQGEFLAKSPHPYTASQKNGKLQINGQYDQHRCIWVNKSQFLAQRD